MKNTLVIAALLGLAFTAITNSAWPWLLAVIGIAAGLLLGRNARLTTRVQLIFVGALGGGLSTEIVRAIYHASTGTGSDAGMYRHVLIVSLGSVIIVLGAMIVEYLLQKLLARTGQ